MNQLNGKIAVITGGIQGLRAAIARRFSEVDAVGMVICGRNSDEGRGVAERIVKIRGLPLHSLLPIWRKWRIAKR